MFIRQCVRSALFVALSVVFSTARAEVIYDNSQFILSGYAIESREYGDQIDLEGTARTLIELTFFYYGNFTSDGDEGMKVRLYSNETPYDLYRNSPTTLLYESGNMPLKSGYNFRTIENLKVKLPANTLTFTIEFKGLATNEIAGLLLYAPPTVGWSFNEFWARNPNGRWTPFLYSTTDPARRANAGLKLVAQPEGVLSATQTNRNTALNLRGPADGHVLAQTFRAEHSGKLDRVTVSLESSGSPLKLS